MNRPSQPAHHVRAVILLLTVIALGAGCTRQDIRHSVSIDRNTRVALMPITNYSQTPQAGEQAESIVTSLWVTERGRPLVTYPTAQMSELPPINDQVRFENARGWLAQQDVSYYLTGTVQEWRYKSGLDGEPAVSVTLRLYRPDGTLVWSAQSSRAGWDRESVGMTAQKLLRKQIRALLDRNGDNE